MNNSTMYIYSYHNTLEAREITFELINARFVFGAAAQLTFIFDAPPPQGPAYGSSLDSQRILVAGSMNGLNVDVEVFSEADIAQGVVAVSPPLTQSLTIQLGRSDCFVLKAGEQEGRFALRIRGGQTTSPNAEAPLPELIKKARAESKAPMTQAEPGATFDFLTATAEADSAVDFGAIVELSNGAIRYDVPLPTAVFAGIGPPGQVLFFPTLGSFGVFGTVNALETMFYTESSASELQGNLEVAPETPLSAALKLSTLRAGGEFTFPAGSRGGPFALPFGGASSASLHLREELRAARPDKSRFRP